MIDKKKLKEEYKNMVPPKGVFAFRNTVTGRVFLGSSLNLKNKDATLKMMLKVGKEGNQSVSNCHRLKMKTERKYYLLLYN